MALNLLKPRIEWNELSIEADTHSSTLVDGIADVSQIKVGMIVVGSGIPVGAKVDSIGVNSFNLDVAATTTLANTTLTLFQRFDFEFPPVTDSMEKRAPSNNVKTSLSGLTQVQTNHIEINRDVSFSFITEDDRNILLLDFYDLWAVYGKEFRYFYDQDDSGFVTYELDKFPMETKRTVKKHPYFLYDMKFSFRRVL